MHKTHQDTENWTVEAVHLRCEREKRDSSHTLRPRIPTDLSFGLGPRNKRSHLTAKGRDAEQKAVPPTRAWAGLAVTTLQERLLDAERSRESSGQRPAVTWAEGSGGRDFFPL